MAIKAGNRGANINVRESKEIERARSTINKSYILARERTTSDPKAREPRGWGPAATVALGNET
jgi:hypothetical protein